MATKKKKETEEQTTEPKKAKRTYKKRTTKEEQKQEPEKEKKQETKQEPGTNKTTTQEEEEHAKTLLEEIGDTVGKFAKSTVDSIKSTIDKSMSSRNTVVSVRVNEESNKKLSMLVDAGLFKSRSESAAFLIEEGIKHQEPLFQKITAKLEKIEKLKNELKDIISLDD